jgi:uncharacterized protein
MGALPAILPVQYLLWDDDVVFRTAPGTKLTAALLGAVVGFEIDGTEDDLSHGWSVLVVGHATEVRDPATLALARQLPLQPWSAAERDHFVRIPTEHMSGRAFGQLPT